MIYLVLLLPYVCCAFEPAEKRANNFKLSQKNILNDVILVITFQINASSFKAVFIFMASKIVIKKMMLCSESQGNLLILTSDSANTRPTVYTHDETYPPYSSWRSSSRSPTTPWLKGSVVKERCLASFIIFKSPV